MQCRNSHGSSSPASMRGQRSSRGAAGTIALVALLAASPPAPSAAADAPAGAAAARRPNILVIYSDDHGWADLGIQGVDTDVRTPHLDQLARDGVRFTRGYVTAPQCVPSRAALLTGRYQQRFGVEDNAKGPLPLAEVTIAERLKAAGYVTGQVGKWHLDIGIAQPAGKESPQPAPTNARRDAGKPAATRSARKAEKGLLVIPEHMPHGQGFDEYWRGERREFAASHDLAGRPYADAPHAVVDPRFRVEVQTEAALAFLDRRAAAADRPWFLYLAWYAPHVPLEPPEPWFSRTPAHLPRERRQALAMIAAMDDGLGRIRARLATMGADRDTLILFIGDNGAPLGDSWNGSLNRPLVGQKGMVAEGGIRTPFLATWPGTLPAGRVDDRPVISLDVAATAVAAAGLAPDGGLDGVNLLPFLTDAAAATAAPHDALYWRWGSQAAVLEMPWKLIVLGDRPPLLFDVTDPAGEQAAREQSATHPDVVARLGTKLRAWAATLEPPGLVTDPSAFGRHHEQLFAEHGVTAPPAGRKARPTR